MQIDLNVVSVPVSWKYSHFRRKADHRGICDFLRGFRENLYNGHFIVLRLGLYFTSFRKFEISETSVKFFKFQNSNDYFMINYIPYVNLIDIFLIKKKNSNW